MCPLGDLFSLEDKKRFADTAVVIGSVLKFYCQRAQKEKRFIIVGKSYCNTKLALIYINSEINPNVYPTPQLKALHILLEKTDLRDYIIKDCFVCCAQIIPYNIEALKNKVLNNLDVFLGTVNDKDMKDICACITGAKTITPAQKKEFGLFFKNRF